MTRHMCLNMVLDELKRAEKLYPDWPDNAFAALNIVDNVFKKVRSAVYNYKHGKGDCEALRKELIQLAAMSLRILFNSCGEK